MTVKHVLPVLVLLVMSVLPARATVLIPADLGELSHDAIAIARGRVAALDAQWSEDHGTIETMVTLEVESYLKGSLGSTLRFRVPGGELGRFRSVVVGAPQFAIDQRVVVFLGARGPSVPFVLGLSQGVFRLSRAADNSGWLVTSPILGPSVAGATTRIVRGDPARRSLPLGDFEQTVRALEFSVLAKYAFGLAQLFNAFYHRYPILNEEDVARRRLPAVERQSRNGARGKRAIGVLKLEDVAKPSHRPCCHSLPVLSASAPYPSRAMMGNG